MLVQTLTTIKLWLDWVVAFDWRISSITPVTTPVLYNTWPAVSYFFSFDYSSLGVSELRPAHTTSVESNKKLQSQDLESTTSQQSSNSSGSSGSNRWVPSDTVLTEKSR